jgi:hypothetical protein
VASILATEVREPRLCARCNERPARPKGTLCWNCTKAQQKRRRVHSEGQFGIIEERDNIPPDVVVPLSDARPEALIELARRVVARAEERDHHHVARLLGDLADELEKARRINRNIYAHEERFRDWLVQFIGRRPFQ